MPTETAHLGAAKRNQKTIDFLLPEPMHDPWAATIALYKALHAVEAMLASGKTGSSTRHTDNHKDRHYLLKSTPAFSHIWKHYQPLYQASRIARYLQTESGSETVFGQYMDATKVRQVLLGHYLKQVEKSICRLVGDASYLSEAE